MLDAPTLTPAQIARESAKIGGFFPTKRNERDPEYVALVSLYKDVLGSHEPRLTSPIIFNAAICCTSGAARWRTGIPAEFRGLPKAEACRHLHRRWWKRVLHEMPDKPLPLGMSGDANLAARICMQMYAEFLCIRPFRNGNGRTALLVLYMLRRYAGLPLDLIEYERAPQLGEYVRNYRKSFFLPRMQAYGFMMKPE
jgi:hypothetical protein